MIATTELSAEDTHIAMIVADATGTIRSWNRGAEMLFGHAAEAALRHRVDLVVPHQYREMHWAGFTRTMGPAWSGHDSWGDIDGLHGNGSLLPLQVLLTPLRDHDGLVHGVFAMFRRRPVAG